MSSVGWSGEWRRGNRTRALSMLQLLSLHIALSRLETQLMNNSQQGFLLKWPLDLVLWHFSANYKCRCPERLWDKGGLREAAAVGKCHFLSLANASNGEYCLKKAASAGCKQPIESPQSSTQLHNTLQSCTSQKCTGFQNVQNAVRLHCRVQQQAMH